MNEKATDIAVSIASIRSCGERLQRNYNMKNEKKAICTMWYQGRDRVEVLHYATVYGTSYADVRFMDGRRHTVPTDELYNTRCEVKHDFED